MTTYHTGDFILTHGTSFFDRLIQFWTHSHWNHAALIIDDQGTIIEATGSGVKQADMTKYEGKEEYYLVSSSFSAEDQAEIRAYAEMMVARHTQYGFLTIVTLTLRTLFNLWPIIKQDNTLICSELVAKALEHGGHVWNRDTSFISPGELLAEAEHHSSLHVVKKTP